jgi:glycosyltransferase involved in cell wall biosynthesis
VTTDTCLVVCHGFSHQSSGYLVRVQRMLATLRKANLRPRVVWFVPLKQLLTGHGLACPHLRDVPVTYVPLLPGLRRRWLIGLSERVSSWLLGRACSWWRPAFVQAENTDAMRLCTRLRVPVVFDLHGDTIAETHPAVTDDSQLAALPAAAVERQLLARADHLVCASRNLGELLRHRHGRLPATTVVPCATDWESFFAQAPRRDAERARLGVTDRLVLCYLGGLSPWQCVAETLALVARLKQRLPTIYFLLLTTQDPRPHRAALDRLGRPGADYAVRALGAADVPAALAAVDAGFLLRARSPVNHVASPTKCGEYLAAGAPVICTRYAGDAAPLIAETGAGVVLDNPVATDGEVDTVAAFLREVAAQPDAWRCQAMNVARTRCDWAACEKDLVRVYHHHHRQAAAAGVTPAPAPAVAPH